MIFSCSYSETIKNPKIDKTYIDYSSKISSIRNGDTINPKYTISFTKNTNKEIAYFKFQVNYQYGQSFAYTDTKIVIWKKGDESLKELNENGKVIYSVSLNNIKRETNKREDKQLIFQEPDAENIEIVLWELIQS
jgi:hypothetical protein